MLKGKYLYDEVTTSGTYKVYEVDMFGNNVAMIVRQSDGERFLCVADILKMCELPNRGSYSSNLTNNSRVVIKLGRRVYVDAMAMISYIAKGRNEGIVKVKEKFTKMFMESVDISE